MQQTTGTWRQSVQQGVLCGLLNAPKQDNLQYFISLVAAVVRCMRFAGKIPLLILHQRIKKNTSGVVYSNTVNLLSLKRDLILLILILVINLNLYTIYIHLLLTVNSAQLTNLYVRASTWFGSSRLGLARVEYNIKDPCSH